MDLIAWQTNYSTGYVVETLPNGTEPCESWLLLPAENLWPSALRGILYFLAMAYIFIGITIGSDVFMCSIEVITSKKRKVVRWDEERQETVEREVLLWNETIANLTLLALGSSAPEIMLNIIEAVKELGNPPEDGLGPFTIVGSAAFNLLVINAICVASVPSPEIKAVREFGVFVITSLWSMFAYVWMLVVVLWVTPGVIDVWEAWVTLGFTPLLVLTAYAQDSGWWCKRQHSRIHNSEPSIQEDMNVRVIGSPQGRASVLNTRAPTELLALEGRNSHANLRQASEPARFNDRNLNDMDRPSQQGQQPTNALSRARERQKDPSTTFQFRHAVVRSMLYQKKAPKPKARFAEVVTKMVSIKALTSPAMRRQLAANDMSGKFTFGTHTYSVLESSGAIEVDVLFHRRRLSKLTLLNSMSKLNLVNKSNNGPNNGPVVNGTTTDSGQSSAPSKQDEAKEDVSVEFETRDGTGKTGKDYTHTQGRLVFKETEYRKKIKIPIINDQQYQSDKDFYVILKSPAPREDAALGDPSVARVTIIDDDKPGNFVFEQPIYYGDSRTFKVTATVLRQNGTDGNTSVEYTTMDGTAKGGPFSSPTLDYISNSGVLYFAHGETSKQISINLNKEKMGHRNFVILLRNPSLGSKIGEPGAAVGFLCKEEEDELAERVANVVPMGDTEEEDTSWGGQFRSAMCLESEEDEDGKKIPPSVGQLIMHFVTFFWKVLFAFIPPRSMLGGWPAFVMSLGFITMLTAFIETLGHLLGCVFGVRTSVTGITIIALGTSVPDTFASRTVAIHDVHADAAIGNVTGSNSVNVFLGLGLPWVISTMYHLINGTQYRVLPGNLRFAVFTFLAVGSLCLLMLFVRRKCFGGELGGKKVPKWISALLMFSFWVVFIVLCSLKAYDLLPF
ncbi:sodium/calcium exchanger 3-like isoform X5 [Branchiostoma floridae]|uniref:Sodium/calcium exchanger 3-like isoform X5 n=1 Tax=Branchiostoma floridae TaxID=7739 RepID=A0A9J7KRU5_BRAFL|nr:sodium/calcium exchanger 3-like isoform X5 [Branchiostoma floridae]